MPTYEFICTACEKIFSHILTLQERGKRKRFKCPDCGSTKTESHHSSMAFSLKGHGWPSKDGFGQH